MEGTTVASKTLHPTLDTDAWVNSAIKTADYLLSHFFLSDYSQTAHFKGQVASFAWIVQRYQGDIARIQEELQSTLAAHFEKQFTNVEIQVGEVPNPDSINRQQLSLYLVFTDSTGAEFNLSRIIQYSDNLKITNIISVNNTGS